MHRARDRFLGTLAIHHSEADPATFNLIRLDSELEGIDTREWPEPREFRGVFNKPSPSPGADTLGKETVYDQTD